MLKMKRLELHNFLKHELLQIEFPSSGIITVLGANGTGKSAVIKAIIFALTGSLDISKEQTLRWGATEGSVKLEFTLDGEATTYTLTRKLHTSGSTLKSSDGLIDLRAAAKITEFMVNRVGVDSQRSRFCLIGQGKLTDLIDANKSARVDAFNTLFRNDDFESLHELLGGFLGSAGPTDSVHEIEVLEQNVAERRLQRDNLAKLVEGYRERHDEAAKAMVSPLDDLLELLGVAKSVQRELSAAGSDVAETLQFLADTKDSVVEHEAKVAALERTQLESSKRLNELNALVTATQDRVGTAKRLATDLLTYKDLLTQAESTAKAKAEADQELADAERAEPIAGNALTEARAQHSHNEAEARETNSLLNRLGSSGRCPTCCTTVIVQRDGHKSDFNELTLGLKAELATINVRLEASSRLVNERQAAFDAARLARVGANNRMYVAAMQSNSAAAALEAVNRRLSNNRDLEASAVQLEVAKLEQELKALEAQVAQCTSDGTNARNAVFTLRLELQNLRNQQTMLQKHADRLIALKSEPAAQLDIPATEARISAFKQTRADLDAAQRQLSELDQQLASIAAEARTRRVNLAVENRRAELVGLLTIVRNVFHRTKLPTQLSSVFLGDLNAAWNETLRQLDVPFIVSVQPNFDVLLHYTDADVQATVDSASGGQRCCLSLALHLAINRVFFANFGVLVLDEPTYGLDSAHVDRLVELMARVNEASGTSGLQIVVVSHENRFKTGFQQCLELG